MQNRWRHPAFLVFAVVAIAAGAWLATRPSRGMQVTLRFQPMAGAEALTLGQGTYANPGGGGEFTVRDFQFFVSNIRLVGEGAEFKLPDSYHLVRFDSDDGDFVISMDSVPRSEYSHLAFGIGVDSVANGTLMSVGDVDPNGRMAWNWEVGYKFVLFEGGLQLDDGRIPLVYHVGFDENYAEVTIPLDTESFQGEGIVIDLCADVLRMFAGDQVVDMSELSDVKFDRADARLLANNYADMVSLCP